MYLILSVQMTHAFLIATAFWNVVRSSCTSNSPQYLCGGKCGCLCQNISEVGPNLSYSTGASGFAQFQTNQFYLKGLIVN